MFKGGVGTYIFLLAPPPTLIHPYPLAILQK